MNEYVSIFGVITELHFNSKDAVVHKDNIKIDS